MAIGDACDQHGTRWCSVLDCVKAEKFRERQLGESTRVPKNIDPRDHDMNTFSGAFQAAHEKGYDEFLWRGNPYHTRRADGVLSRKNLGLKKQLYMAGSLRNPAIVELHKRIEAGCDWRVFSDWKAAHEQGDDAWKEYEQALGYSYIEALARPAARNVYEFDKRHIDASDAMVLVLPAGKSGHLELGYAIGRGKRGFILLEAGADPRWDIMYQFAEAICETTDDLIAALKEDIHA